MKHTHDLIVIARPRGPRCGGIRGQIGRQGLHPRKKRLGGTCTHRGCIPTKALLASSKRFADLKKLTRMGSP
jgi:dihydrolipoamide dehydrogenase